MSNKFIIENENGQVPAPLGWQGEWVGMPSFEQDDLRPHRAINVRFRSEEDVAKFEKLIGQEITPKQKAVWFPEMKNRLTSHLIYVDAPAPAPEGDS